MKQGARRTADGYLAIFDRIAQEKLDANVSLKLTQLGLDLGAPLCEGLARKDCCPRGQPLEFRPRRYGRIGLHAADDRNREARPCKKRECWNRHAAYLYRTEQDVRDLLAVGCGSGFARALTANLPILLFPKKADVDANYVKLMKILLPSGIYHGIATHDPAMIEATKNFVREKNIGRDKFEFQMLYGIRTDLQKQLVREGFRLRIYIPYGSDWFPYFMRRLAERPANLTFFLRSLLPRSS